MSVAKEIAVKLVNKYITLRGKYDSEKGVIPDVVSSYRESKQCAIIACDEIIDSHKGSLHAPANKMKVKIYEDVKTEIEKL